MKKILFLLLLISSFCYGQDIDYLSKKGVIITGKKYDSATVKALIDTKQTAAQVSAIVGDSLTSNEVVVKNNGSGNDSIAVFASGPDSVKFKKPISGSNTTVGSNSNNFWWDLSTTITGLTSVTSTGFTGSLTGNASTSTTLANTRTIWGQNFNGSANVSGDLATTGTRVTKGWFTDGEFTNAPTIGGTAATGSGGLARGTSPLFVTPRLASTSTTGYVWTATDAIGNGSFQAASGGFSDPLTTNGDIIARVSGATTRLAQGSNGSFLGVSGGVLGYYTPAGSGDMVLASAQTSTGKKTFASDATNAGLGFGGVTSDPSSLVNGDVWLNTTTNNLKYRANSVTRTVANLAEAQTFTNKTLTLPAIDNISGATSTIASAAGTTTLTVSSKYNQVLTGSTTQTFVLPDATTLVIGMGYKFKNNSTGNMTVNMNGGSLVKVVAPSNVLVVEVTGIGSSAGTWNSEYSTDLAMGDATATSITYPTGGKVWAEQIATVQADFTLTNATGVQSAFPTDFNVFNAEASVTYKVKGRYIINTGATTHTTAMAFALGGGASVTDFQYTTLLWSAAANTLTTTQSTTHVSGVASKVLNATSTAVYTIIEFEGLLRMNAAGTVTPQIAFSADPTGTLLMKVGSYISFQKMGSNTMTFVGNFN